MALLIALAVAVAILLTWFTVADLTAAGCIP
jgi:hypothetical protein